jgi:hypothetical protein
MMYMPDAIKAAIQLMEAYLSTREHHADFNLAAMSFSAGELAAEIKRHIPKFEVGFEPDFRQGIADYLGLANHPRLKAKAREANYRRGLMVTDGVFSMDGDVAPLDKLYEVAEKYGVLWPSASPPCPGGLLGSA